MDAIRLQGFGRHLVQGIHGLGGGIQDQVSAQQRRDGRAQRIEGLREVQTARGSLRRPQHGNIRIRRDLQKRDATGQHHQGREKQWVGGSDGCRQK